MAPSRGRKTTNDDCSQEPLCDVSHDFAYAGLFGIISGSDRSSLRTRRYASGSQRSDMHEGNLSSHLPKSKWPSETKKQQGRKRKERKTVQVRDRECETEVEQDNQRGSDQESAGTRRDRKRERKSEKEEERNPNIEREKKLRERERERESNATLFGDTT